LLARTDTNGSTFYHSDGSGNITALMNGQEDVVARYMYGPFGKLLGQWGSMAGANEMQFSSMPRDGLSGLSFYPFRAYEPNFQRWLNSDPIGERGGLNLYRFVSNNSANRVDPLGLIDPEELEELQQFLEEDGPVIEDDLEAGAKDAETEAENIWDKTADYFSKAKQSQINQGLGRSAENISCPLKNTTRIPSLNSPGKYRIPDLLDTINKIIGDTKNVQYLSMSPQLRDYADWAAQNGYQFQLTVSLSTRISSTVNAIPNLTIIRQALP
jgi:RHS repeat-associated protein